MSRSRRKERYYEALSKTRRAYGELRELLEKYKRGEMSLDDVVRDVGRLIAEKIPPCLIEEAWAARDYIEELESRS